MQIASDSSESSEETIPDVRLDLLESLSSSAIAPQSGPNEDMADEPKGDNAPFTYSNLCREL